MGLFRGKDPGAEPTEKDLRRQRRKLYVERLNQDTSKSMFKEPDSSGIDRERLDAGLLAQGTVLTIEDSGLTYDDGPAGMPAPRLILTIQVRLDGVPPYEATRVQTIPGMQVSQWQKPGGVVAVRVNPDDHADIAVDFDTEAPTGAAG